MTFNILLLPFLSLLFLHSRPYHTSPFQIPQTAPIATVALLAVVTTLPDLSLPVAAGPGRGGKGPGGPKQGGRKGGGGWDKGKGRGGMGPDGGPLPDGSGDGQVPPQDDSTSRGNEELPSDGSPPPAAAPPSITPPPPISAPPSETSPPSDSPPSIASPPSAAPPSAGGETAADDATSGASSSDMLGPEKDFVADGSTAAPGSEAAPGGGGDGSLSHLDSKQAEVLAEVRDHWGLTWNLSLPCWEIGGLSCNTDGTVQSLDLSSAGLSGGIPKALFHLTTLQYLSLADNSLTGKLPKAVSALTRLETLVLHSNQLSGEVPNVFADMPNLVELSLARNSFDHALPSSLALCSTLIYLNLGGNFFNKIIPEGLGGLINLRTLLLYDNAFVGSIPDTLSDLTLLEKLDLSLNILSGTFPSALLSLPSLKSLDVSNNQLSGPLPSGFASAAISNPDSDGTFLAAQNYFTGEATVLVAGAPFCPSTQPQSPDQALSSSAAETLSGGPSVSPSADLTGLTDSGTAGYPSLLLNCLTYSESSACAKAGLVEQQRTALACAGFCGASLEAGPCGGHGRCVLRKGSGEAMCACDSGFMPGLENATVDGVVVTYTTCSKNPENAVPPPNKPATGSFSTGFQPSIPGGRFFNPYFRYASVGFKGTPSDPSWTYKDSVDWREPSAGSLTSSSSRSGGVTYVGYVRDQGQCAACWAFAAVDTVASAYAIANRLPSVPPLSTQQVLDCAKGDCSSGGFPGDAFRFLASPPLVSSNALCSEDEYPFDGESDSSDQCKGVKGQYRIPLVYEQISFYGWLGIALAVQQHPVVVSVAADSESFKKFTGGYVYNDPACFASGLVSHNLVVVGYNVLAPEPYWILRNSWGTEWGEDGYMRMAITARPDPTGAIDVNGGAGVCGIYATPALYPVVAGPSPCQPNPCGSGACMVVTKLDGSQSNQCRCRRGFVAVDNVDGSQSCAPLRVCALYQTNPCWVGTCVDNNKGSFSCLCPPGFMQGLKADGTTTCVPVISQEDKGTYLITGPGVTCYALAISYGFTQAELKEKNPDLDCSASIPPSTLLDISDSSLAPCSLPYTVTPIDTCDSIAETFNISAAELSSLNPALDCSRLVIGIQICVARGQPYQFPLCTRYHDVADGETCTSLMQVQARPPLSPFEFFAMNPGLMCNNLVPTKPGDGLGGQQVCLSSLPFSAFKCAYRTYYTKRGDTCASIYMKYFRTPAAKAKTTPARLYVQLNSNTVCPSTLRVGYQVCLPKGVRPS
ncbi:unnamed protein product [Closterium sp. NIES-65]|nr:unnamed protein product [Closterium sp. NIES-65]